MGQHISMSGQSVIRSKWGNVDADDDLSKAHTKPEHTSFGNPTNFKTERVGNLCTKVTPICPSGEDPDAQTRSCPRVYYVDQHTLMAPLPPGPRDVPLFKSVRCDEQVCNQIDLNKGVESVVFTHHSKADGSSFCVCTTDNSVRSSGTLSPKILEQKCAGNVPLDQWV